MSDELVKAITTALNYHSAENVSNTPDFILAEFLAACLAAFNTAVQQRETSYGRDARPSETAAALSLPPPALPEELIWWEKADGYAVGPRSKGMIAWVATIEEAQALCAAFRAAAAAMSEDAERYRFWRARYHGEFVLTIHSGGVVSLKFDGEIPSIPIAGPDYEPKVDAAIDAARKGGK